jgi:hypothetical protein
MSRLSTTLLATLLATSSITAVSAQSPSQDHAREVRIASERAADRQAAMKQQQDASDAHAKVRLAEQNTEQANQAATLSNLQAARTTAAAPITALCQQASLLDTLQRIVGKSHAPGYEPPEVLKIYNVRAWASTMQSSITSQFANLINREQPSVDTTTFNPTCVASVITSQGEHQWAYSWKAIDGQTFVNAQQWDN